MENKLSEALNKIELEKNIKNLKGTAQNVSKKYLTSFSIGTPLVQGEREVLSYAFIRMRATYKATSFALGKIQRFNEVSSVLDVGSGTGAALLACLEHEKVKKVDALEVEPSMINLSKEILANIDEKLLDKINYIQADANKFDFNNNYDLVVTSYFLNELTHEERKKIVEKLYNCAKKYLVIVEPGTPENYKEMMEIKEGLKLLGGKVLSPCKCESCPLLGSEDWCHFLTRINRSHLQRELKGGSLGYEDEKFTYLVVSKGNDENKNQNIIIRRPQIVKGKVTIKVCDRDGVSNKIVTKRDKEFYKSIKKLGVGDEF